MEFKPLALGPKVAFEVPVRQGDVRDSPLVVARAIMDRLYQIMGEKRSTLFNDDGTLIKEAADHARGELKALSA